MLPLAAVLAAADAGTPPVTVEGVLLVYGPLGVLALVGLIVTRLYVVSLRERAAAAEARADRVEAELRELHGEFRRDIVPRMTDVTRVMGEVVVELRDRR